MGFFSSENAIFRFTGRLLDIVVLSAMWVVCSLPVVTIGPATAALYYSCVKCLRWKEPSPYRNFIDAFRTNLGTGIGATIIAGIVVVVLYCGDVFFLMATGTGERFWGMMQVTYRVLILVPIGMLTVAFPLLSRFTCTVGSLLSSSLGLTFRHLPRLVLAGIIHLAATLGMLMGWFYGSMLFVPALDMLVLSFLYEPIFRQYTPDEEEDENAETSWYLRDNK